MAAGSSCRCQACFRSFTVDLWIKSSPLPPIDVVNFLQAISIIAHSSHHSSPPTTPLGGTLGPGSRLCVLPASSSTLADTFVCSVDVSGTTLLTLQSARTPTSFLQTAILYLANWQPLEKRGPYHSWPPFLPNSHNTVLGIIYPLHTCRTPSFFSPPILILSYYPSRASISFYYLKTRKSSTKSENVDKTFGHQKQFKITKPQISIRHSLVAQISFLDLYRLRIFFCLSLAVYDTSYRRPPWPRSPRSHHRRYSPTFKPSLLGPLLLSAASSLLSSGFSLLPLDSTLPLSPSPILYPPSHAHAFPPTTPFSPIPTSLPSPFPYPLLSFPPIPSSSPSSITLTLIPPSNSQRRSTTLRPFCALLVIGPHLASLAIFDLVFLPSPIAFAGSLAFLSSSWFRSLGDRLLIAENKKTTII